jgi:hypothetical protein
MDQSASNVAEKTQKPENEKNYKYGPQHKFLLQLIFSGDYVQPRSKKIKSKIGIGIPRSQSKMYPVAPARLILFVLSLDVSQALNFLSEFFLGFAESRLEPAQKFLVFPFGKREVVVS